MKTILRLAILLLVVALIGVGLYLFFQSSTVRSWLGLEVGFGRHWWVGEANGELLPILENQPGIGKGQRHGLGIGGNQKAGFERGEDRDEFPSFAGWLVLLGTLLRLTILMAVVIGLVKFMGWLRGKIKPNGNMNVGNANP